MRTFFVCAVTFLLASTAFAADTLDIYVIDTEGGKSMVMVTPAGEKMLVDGGSPSRDDRDGKRVLAAAELLGIKQFDYILVTHYDGDHVGNIPHIDSLIPAKVFIDHGDPIPTLNANSKRTNYEPYVKAIGDRKRISVKPGDVLPITGLKITVLTAGMKTITSPLPGGGQVNDLAPPAQPDLPRHRRQRGLCRTAIRVRQVPHGRLRRSAFVGRVRSDVPQEPGRHRGPLHGQPSRPAYVEREVLRASPAPAGGHHEQRAPQGRRPRGAGHRPEFSRPGRPLATALLAQGRRRQDAPKDFCANITDPCEGKPIHVVVQRDGTFTVTNTRNGFSKTYKPKQE